MLVTKKYGSRTSPGWRRRRGHGGDERARNASAHRCQIRRTGDGDIGERVHHAPNRAEQTEKRRTTDGRREQNHCDSSSVRFPDSALHRGADRIHLRRGDFVGDTKTGAKSFIHFGRAKQMKCEFLTTSPVNIKDGCADKARISLREQAQGLRSWQNASRKRAVCFGRIGLRIL